MLLNHLGGGRGADIRKLIFFYGDLPNVIFFLHASERIFFFLICTTPPEMINGRPLMYVK